MPEPHDAAAFELRLFGAFEARRGGQPLRIGVRKSVALLAWLALEGRSARGRLTALLWPDTEDEAARRNLRRELFRLRAAGLADALLADDDSAALAGVASDHAAFAAALQQGRDAEADTLYRGPLLDGFELPGCDAFHEWLDTRRGHAARQWRQALQRHAATLQQGGALREALAAQLRLLDDDPLQEAPVRAAMALHQALGERAQALALFERCRRLLKLELGVEPLAETAALADQLRAGLAAVPPVLPVPAAPTPTPGIGPLHAALVGREALLDTLVASPAPVLLLVAEPGLGKSRLLQARAAQASQVLALQGMPLAMQTPLYALAEALRGALAGRPGVLAPLPPAVRAEVARLLPDTAAPRAARAARSEPQHRARFVDALAQALRQLSGAQGLLLFDDVQWADGATLEVLAHLVQRRAAEPAAWPAVLAAARPIDATTQPAAAAFVSAGRQGGWLAEQTLQPLDDTAVLALIRQLSGSSGGQRFAARLAHATGGNPFYLLETLRNLFERNEITLDAQGRWRTRHDDSTTDYAELPLAPTVRAAVLERLARLGPAVLRLLEAAAFAEGSFELDEVAPASALSEWEAVQAVERALTAQLLDRAEGRLRFSHDLVRAALVAQTGPERTRLIHRRLASAQIGRGAPAAHVAAHLQAAGDQADAARWWLKAAGQAAARFAFDDALRLAGLAADSGDATQRFDALKERALVHRSLGRFDAMARDVEALQPLPQARLGRRRQRLARRLQALLLSDTGHLAASVTIGKALLEEGCIDRAEEAELLRTVGFNALFLGRDAEAAEHLARAVPLAQRFRPEHLSPTLAVYAMALWLLGRQAEAESAVRRALATAWEDDPLQRADALNYASMIAETADQRALALARVHEAQQIAQEAGNLPRLAAFLANEVSYRFHGGEAAATRQVQHRLAELIGGRTSPLARYMVASTAARAAWVAGECDEALRTGEAALAIAAQLGGAHETTMAALLARWQLAQGRPAAALELARRAEAVGGASTPLLAAAVVRAWAALQAGDADACLALIERTLTGERRSDQERYLHEDLAACLRGQALLALGRAEEARHAVAAVRFSPTVKAQAAQVRLGAAAQLRDEAAMGAALAEGDALLAGGLVMPLEALALARARNRALQAG